MDVRSLKFENEEHGEELLCHLRDQVFHLTSQAGYDGIMRDGLIRNNRDGMHEINCGSLRSFGRLNGWVCLFDLRGKSKEVIDDSLDRYYFLRPSWFAMYSPDYTEWNMAYLLLKPDHYNNLIPNKEASKVCNTQYVPRVECWYPGDLPLDCIHEVLQVRIRRSASIGNPILYAHQMLALEEQERARPANSKREL